MPPLRERIEDLPLLVRDFTALNVTEGRGRVELSPRALAALALHRWPGNVRELGNLIERLSIVSGGRIADIASLPAKFRPSDWSPELEAVPEDEAQTGEFAVAPVLLDDFSSAAPEPMREDGREPQPAAAAAAAADDLAQLPPGGIDLREHLAAIERRLIEQALERTGGTVAHAARLLNLRRTTLVEKLRKLGIADVSSLTLFGQTAPGMALALHLDELHAYEVHE